MLVKLTKTVHFQVSKCYTNLTESTLSSVFKELSYMLDEFTTLRLIITKEE